MKKRKSPFEALVRTHNPTTPVPERTNLKLPSWSVPLARETPIWLPKPATSQMPDKNRSLRELWSRVPLRGPHPLPFHGRGHRGNFKELALPAIATMAVTVTAAIVAMVVTISSTMIVTVAAAEAAMVVAIKPMVAEPVKVAMAIIAIDEARSAAVNDRGGGIAHGRHRGVNDGRGRTIAVVADADAEVSDGVDKAGGKTGFGARGVHGHGGHDSCC